jgi:trehalose synthase
MHEVPVVPRSIDALANVVDLADLQRFRDLSIRARARLDGNTIWHVNSTAEGGGVSELLRSTLGYLRAGGIDTRWVVIEGNTTFFDITKRIHNRLHGDLGDGGPLSEEERRRFADTADHNLGWLRNHITPGDVVVVHDPQPLGLVGGLADAGATVIWTCHVGIDVPNDIARSAWDFLRPFLRSAAATTFTRKAYVWEGLDPARVVMIPPCIDGLSLKNAVLDPAQREAILGAAGVATPSLAGRPTFLRSDGADGVVVHTADMVEEEPVPSDAPLVVQVSRWDRLKDPAGVLQGFVDDPDLAEAHLMLAGPAPSSVADDPEAITVLSEIRTMWSWLRPADRRRVHLADLPTHDVEENAVIVNALQRRADVVVQKSLAEGFGLTVTEGMWKARPMVASCVGGIQDQIEDGVTGLLVDPRDLTAFGNAVQALLEDRELAGAMGERAHRRVRSRYLAPHYLGDYLQLIDELAER